MANVSSTSSLNHRRPAISPPPTKKRKRASSKNNNDDPEATVQLAPSRWLKLFSWNINGIAPFILPFNQPAITTYFRTQKFQTSDPDPNSTASLRAFLRRHQWPQILLLQEVKMKPTDESSKRAVEKAINIDEGGCEDGPRYVVRFCLPRDNYNARGFGGKVYGVATIIREDFYQDEVERVRTVEWDLEGRVLVLETKSKLSIWNIYAVNGTMNDYKSSETGQVIGTRHDRKLAFHKLLLQDCKGLEADGFHIVIAGDMNVSPQRIDGFPNIRTIPEQHVKNRADYNSKFFDAKDGLHAIDSFRHLHPETKKYTWVARDRPFASCCDRVDHIILSRSLVEGDLPTHGALKEADILMTAAERGLSDHVPIYVCLDLRALEESAGGSAQ